MPCKIIINKTNVNNWLNATTYLFSESSALIIFCFFQADASNDYTSRFLGFSLYISNTTNKSEGALCFQDINFNRSTIPDVFSTKCTEKGQYVIFTMRGYRKLTILQTFPPMRLLIFAKLKFMVNIWSFISLAPC